MRVLLVGLLLLMTACASDPKVVVVTKEVSIPVVVKCKVKFPEKPQLSPTPVSTLTTYTKVLWIMQENVEYRTYSAKLEAALSACADPE